MMSSGFAPQGEHATARTLTSNESIPSTFAKIVSTSAAYCTTTAFTGSQPGAEAKHFVVTVVVTD